MTGAVITFHDIGERKRAEAALQRMNEELEVRVRARTSDLRAANAHLRERETRLDLLLAQTPAAIWSLDTALRFTFASGAPLATLGLTPADIVGRRLSAFLVAQAPATDAARETVGIAVREHRRALAGEPTLYTVAWQGRTFQVYIEPQRGERGAIVGTIAIAQDITELSQRRRHDEFIATISHQLLTPLAAARAGVGLLEAGVADQIEAEDRRLLGNIGRNIGRLGIHLNDLITLNQLKSGTLPFLPEPLDLRAVVADALNVVHPLLREKGQELVADLPVPLPLAGSRDELAQALINLLVNAHRHTPVGTRVAIGGRVAGGEVILTVSDTGPGIPDEAREAIFRRFHRLAVSDATATPGSGLGLAIVQGIAELHGGRVWAAGAPGRGAAFHLALPHSGDGNGANDAGVTPWA